MKEFFSRTELLLGSDALEKLKNARVAVFGIGGVGSYAAEALARSGVGALDLIDSDKVAPSNINRQLYALKSTIGKYKTEVAKERIHDINSECKVNVHNVFFLPDTENEFDFEEYDYVVDAIDTVTGKIALIKCANAAGTKIISSMGAGNKLDPTAFEVSDIYKTSVCPLAKVMRKELKARGIKSLKVVYSKEKPLKPLENGSCVEENSAKRQIPGSIAFVPSVAGLIIAGEVVKDIIGYTSQN